VQQANTNSVAEPPRANGHSTLDDIFALTDEQILGVVPEPAGAGGSQDVEFAEAAPPASLPSSAEHADASQPAPAADTASQPSATGNTAAAPAAFSDPEDVRAVAELYPGGLTQAKTAAERARLLDDIDRAYFGAQGSTPEQARASRAELAQMMLREDPAAFREMVFAGLHALEAAGASARTPNAPGAFSQGPNASTANATSAAPHATVAQTFRPEGSPQQQSVAAPSTNTLTPEGVSYNVYAEFEKAANADLEKSVGGAIERALHQALPNLSAADQSSSAGPQHSAPLQARLSQAIRHDVEKALQGDRQLGEQVAQILAGRRFDHETRAQVVRLINDRAQQLVPGAAKRALHDWTQTTLAAHRARSERADVASTRREVATAAPGSRDVHATQNVAHPFRGEASQSKPPAQAPRSDTRSSAKNRFDYRRLSDEQILDL